MRAGSNWRHLNGLSLGMMGDPVRCLPKVVHPDVAALKLQHNLRDDPSVNIGRPDVPSARSAERLDHLRCACGSHRLERVVAFRAKSRREPKPLGLGRLSGTVRLTERPVPSGDVVALGDRPVEQTLRLRHQQQRHHGASPGGLTEDRHAARVTAKRVDIVADPLESRDHIHQPVVA